MSGGLLPPADPGRLDPEGAARVGRWKDHVIFEKPCPGGWVLRKIAHAEVGAPPGKGCYWDEHALIQPSSGASTARPHWEWAEWDRGRLVWAVEGRLEAGRLTAQGLADEKVLSDFNELMFAPIEAPY